MEQKETLSEEVKEFNPDAFAGLDALVEKVEQTNKSKSKEDEPSALMDESDEVQAATAETEEDDDSDFDWGLNEEEEEQAEEEVLKESESNDDWDLEEESEDKESGEEDSIEDKGVNWDAVAEQLGLQGASKEDIVKALNSKNEPEVKNETTTKYEGYLQLTDRELLGADMKATGMDEYDVDDSLDKMEDSGMLKHEALKIRKQLRNAIRTEKDAVKKKKDSESIEKTQSQDQARKDLQSELKGFKNYLGGKVTVEQRKDLYKYITNGDFNKDIYESHANVAEAAFLWKNRSQLQKMLRSQGFEDGKGSVLDNLTNRGGRGNSKPKRNTGSGFDASAFMGE
tara:strand:+ start:13787 stop:14809 length:1023 start_codon:yes stop_codon:yes gene_type:complete